MQDGGAESIFDRIKDLESLRAMPDGDWRVFNATVLFELSQSVERLAKKQAAHDICKLPERQDEITKHLDDLAAAERNKVKIQRRQLYLFGLAGAAVGLLSNIGRIVATIRGWFT